MVIINVKAEKGGDGGRGNYCSLNIQSEIWGNPLTMQEVEDHESSLGGLIRSFIEKSQLMTALQMMFSLEVAITLGSEWLQTIVRSSA